MSLLASDGLSNTIAEMERENEKNGGSLGS